MPVKWAKWANMPERGDFSESLFREDKNNVNIAQTNFMRFIFSIKSSCCSIVSITV